MEKLNKELLFVFLIMIASPFPLMEKAWGQEDHGYQKLEGEGKAILPGPMWDRKNGEVPIFFTQEIKANGQAIGDRVFGAHLYLWKHLYCFNMSIGQDECKLTLEPFARGLKRATTGEYAFMTLMTKNIWRATMLNYGPVAYGGKWYLVVLKDGKLGKHAISDENDPAHSSYQKLSMEQLSTILQNGVTLGKANKMFVDKFFQPFRFFNVSGLNTGQQLLKMLAKEKKGSPGIYRIDGALMSSKDMFESAKGAVSPELRNRLSYIPLPNKIAGKGYNDSLSRNFGGSLEGMTGKFAELQKRLASQAPFEENVIDVKTTPQSEELMRRYVEAGVGTEPLSEWFIKNHTLDPARRYTISEVDALEAHFREHFFLGEDGKRHIRDLGE